jgi:CRISPR-associated Csx3 family protein
MTAPVIYSITFYDPRLGAVVVASHSREWQVGQVLDVTLPASCALSAR